MSNKPYQIIIEPNKNIGDYWKDLWAYKGLFYFLVWRDVLVRYKQTTIGVAWSIIRPLITLVIFTIVFGELAKFPSGGVPYSLLVYTAMLPWLFFSSAFAEASNSIMSNSNILTKVYFPRIIVPASTIIVSLIDFFITLTLLLLLMAFFRFTPSWHIITLPFFIILVVAFSMGSGFLVAAFNVKYRDVRYLVSIILQLGMYVSPVAFSSSLIPEKWRMLYALNPMVGIIDGFRWCLLGGQNELNPFALSVSIVFSSAVLFFGIRQFRRMEKTFADII